MNKSIEKLKNQIEKEARESYEDNKIADEIIKLMRRFGGKTIKQIAIDLNQDINEISRIISYMYMSNFIKPVKLYDFRGSQFEENGWGINFYKLGYHE